MRYFYLQYSLVLCMNMASTNFKNLINDFCSNLQTFLADYGMVWVGTKSDPKTSVYHDTSEPDTADAEVWRPQSSLADQSFDIDYNLVIANINDLNVLAGDGTHKIQHTTDGARLKVVISYRTWNIIVIHFMDNF